MSEDNTIPETVTIPVKMFRILGWIISAAIAGAGSSIGIRSINPSSYDSFTGQDGRDLKGELVKYNNEKVEGVSSQLISYIDAKIVYDVVPIDERLSTLEEAVPKTFPPLEWQIDWGTWRTGIIADLNAIKADDRHTQEQLDELRENCINHMEESIEWKQLIKKNEQSIDNLWKWFQRRTE